MAARQQDFITEARGHVRQLVEALNGLESLQPEATYLDYANSLEDGTGANDGITRAEVIAVVFTSADAIRTLLASGHGSNLAKLL